MAAGSGPSGGAGMGVFYNVYYLGCADQLEPFGY